VTLERMWAGWRSGYVDDLAAVGRESRDDAECVFCRIMASDCPDDETFVLWRGRSCLAILNAYPYTNGHLMVMPMRHVGDLAELEPSETSELWAGVQASMGAIMAAYQPEGMNMGANLGKAAGAGVPGHLHVHCLPRWSGDTNFVTSIASLRVLPETLATSHEKLLAAWPQNL